MTRDHPIWISVATATALPQPPSNTRPEADAELSRASSMTDHAAVWVAHRPWLAAVAVVGLAVWAVGRIALAAWRHQYHADHAERVTIAPPPEVDPAGAQALWSNLSRTLSPSLRRPVLYGTPHVVWEYRWIGRHLTIKGSAGTSVDSCGLLGTPVWRSLFGQVRSVHASGRSL